MHVHLLLFTLVTVDLVQMMFFGREVMDSVEAHWKLHDVTLVSRCTLLQYKQEHTIA